MINESYTCKRINKLIELNELTSENLMIIINDNSSKELKNICNLTLSRINEIIKGSQMSWRADSDRLHVIGFHERRKSCSNTI